jgi:hypothetical protein
MSDQLVRIHSAVGDAQSLNDALSKLLDHDEVQLQIEARRQVDTQVLVAVISGGATVLVALINALAQIAQKGSAKKLTLKTAKGDTLDIAASSSREELSNAVERAKELGTIVDIEVT